MPRLLHICLCVFFSSIVLHQKTATIAAIGISIFWLFFKPKKLLSKKIIISIILFFSLYVISWLLNPLSREYSFEVEKRISLLLIIPFFTRDFIDVRNLKTYVILFCISVMIAQTITLASILSWYVFNGAIDLTIGKDISEVLFIHRPYLGFFTFISTFLLYLFYKNKRIKWLPTLALCIFNTFFLAFIGARASLFFQLMAFLIFLIDQKKMNWIKAISNTFLIFTVGLLTTFHFQKERFHNIQNNEPRLFIWQQATDVKTDNLLFGFFSQPKLQKALDKKYENEFLNNRKYYWVHEDQLHWNTHNQFLDLFLSYGIIGIFILSSIFFYLVQVIKKEHKNIFNYFVLCLILFSLVENIFARQWGILIISSLTPLLILVIQFLERKDVLSAQEK